MDYSTRSRNTSIDKEEVFDFLDDLRESGVTNMLGSGPYIQREFGVSRGEARELLLDWMDRAILNG